MRVVALLPMRHASVRVPGKNYRPFAGRPLYHHILAGLRACPRIAEVVIDTDSALLKEDAEKHFPGTIVLERPEHLRPDTTPMNDVLLNTISRSRPISTSRPTAPTRWSGRRRSIGRSTRCSSPTRSTTACSP